MTRATPEEIARRLRGTPLIIMLDIDGTLCEIVERPDAANIPEPARATLRSLIAERSRGVHVAFVTGRSVAGARRMLAIEGVTIYGNHGMEHLSESGNITWPEGWENAGTALREAKRDLDALVARFPGTGLEDKQFSLSLHYRDMDMKLLPSLRAAVAGIGRERGVEVAPGKCVFNITPSASVNKGDAVRAIVHELGGESPDASIFFAGDDVTDEDAFRALRTFPDATTVHVGAAESTTDARFSMDGPSDIHALLTLLAGSRS